MTLAELIRSARKNAGLTQKQLGEKSGLFDSAIRKYESGRQNPKYETVQKIANALKLPVSYFYPPIDPNDPDDAKIFGRYIKNGEVELPGLVNSEYMEEVARRDDLNESFSKLNETGQNEAVKRVSELTEIPRFQKPEQSE